MKHVKQSTKIVIVTATHAKRHDYSRLTLLAIALLVAIIVYVLFAPRVHGDNTRIVGFLPQMQRSVKPEPTIIDASSMTATPATATPQPEAQ